MNTGKKYIIKNSIDNFAVAFIMSFTASFLGFAGQENLWQKVVTSPSTWYCIPFSYALSWVLTLTVPSAKISSFFARFFGLDPSKISGVAFGDLFTNIYICAILSFCCKMLIFLPDFNKVISYFLSTYLIQYVISYLTFEISNCLTLHFIYGKWKKEEKKQCME